MSPASNSPAIDRSAIATFTELVFDGLTGLVPIRMLAETGTPEQKPQSRYIDIAKLGAALPDLATSAARVVRGLYVVPGTVSAPGSARAKDIVQTRVLLVDLDKGDIGLARDHLHRHLGAPSLEVASGGRTGGGDAKLHLYWRLSQPATGDDLERVRALRETVALKVGGDGSFASLHQPIRVPGSIHGKNAKLSPVRLLSSTTAMYSLDELVARAAAMSQLVDVGATPPRKNRPTAGELMTRKTRAGGADDVTRFEALSRVIGHWIRQARQGRCSLDEARQAAVDYNTALIVPPWDASRLEREFDRLLEKDIHRHGPFGAPGLQAPPLSEDAIAAAFVARHAEDTRYCAALGGWMWWCSTHWQRDDRSLVREFMRQVCRSVASSADAKPIARRIASDRTVTAALRLAAADPAISSTVGAWDNAPMCLNTAAGLLDLETGEMHDHDPARLLTQVADALPGGSCPRWLRFLDRITDGDRELQTYLQRVAGYCLTGSTREQVFFFFHGTGANGKSVFLQTLSAVLGNYAATAAPGTFTASRSDRHLTELAGLRGARLVVAFETESGQSWAEGRIKTVTGGEPIRANFMHRDHFEFRPQFKLIVAGNHRPALTSVNEAIRRRLHLVPFPVTIPDEDRDLLLSDRLLEERHGILAWAIEGCAEWQRHGLAPPPAITGASAGYIDDEDTVGEWIEECCVTGPDCRAPARALYASWAAWAEAAGATRGSQKSLGEALRERGFQPAKVSGARGWQGIAPRHRQPQAEAA